MRDPHARRLMVGETFNPPGHWSSFPPHKHDGRNGEPFLEEVYYFRVDPPHGFGHQMLYTEDGESVTHQVRDGDAVLLPYGYHPVSSPPGYCALLPLGDGRRRAASWRSTKIRRIAGFTIVLTTCSHRLGAGSRRADRSNHGVVAVIRMQDPDRLRAVVDALAAGGVRALEVTMTVPRAIELIAEIAPTLPPEFLLGAGTVLDAGTAAPRD